MTTNISILADRHFRPDPQGVLAPKEATQHGRVLITVADNVAGTQAGQHTGWILTNLLSRQFGVVAEIALNVPNVPLLPDTAAFGAKDTFLETLEECIKLVAGQHIAVEMHTEPSKDFDIHLVVGSSGDKNLARRTLCIYADGWRWYVGTGEKIPNVLPTSALSFGPYLAASLAAGEVFKHLRGLLADKGEFITESFGSVWSLSVSSSWDELDAGPSPEQIPQLPHVYFAGAGAVAQAAALTLGSSRIAGRATVVDHDLLDLTNDNRYVLSTIQDDGEPKVELLSSYLNARGFACHPIKSKWSEYVGLLGQKAIDTQVGELERQYRFPIVLSCVDKNEPRHEIQSLVPKIIIGGSTDGLVAKAQTFYLGHECACLKCFNPIEDRNETLRRNRKELERMSAEEQSAWCQERNISKEDLARFLAPPECGKLSESDLERFAKGPPEMSVGFVSMAAGISLATQLIRLCFLGIDDATSAGHLSTLTFARVGMRQRKTGPQADCSCISRIRRQWHQLWTN